MKDTEKMTLSDYDKYCQEHCQNKIPDWENKDHYKRLGDCIYDFSTDPPKMRKGVHGEGNRKRDLGGENALLSSHFYYFGDSPIDLPKDLYKIIKKGQGHKSQSNAPYVDKFISWIESPNRLYGMPQLNIIKDTEYFSKCAEYHREESEADEQLAINC